MITFKQGDSVILNIKFDTPMDDYTIYARIGSTKTNSHKTVTTSDDSLTEVSDTEYTFSLTPSETIDMCGEYKLEMYVTDGTGAKTSVNTILFNVGRSDIAKELLQTD